MSSKCDRSGSAALILIFKKTQLQQQCSPITQSTLEVTLGLTIAGG